MWKQNESRQRPIGSNAWVEPLESRTLMAAHGVSDLGAMTMDRTHPSQPTVTTFTISTFSQAPHPSAPCRLSRTPA